VTSNIPDEIEFTNRGVIIGNNFIISDLHIGYSDVVESMSIEDEREEIIDRLKYVYKENQIDSVIIAGDIFHEFGSPSRSARNLLKSIQRISSKHRVEFIAIKGNHDTEAVANSRYLVDFKQEYYFTSNIGGSEYEIGVIHGHEKPSSEADLFVLGHLHPIVRIDGVDWPVYLFGENIYGSSDTVVLPAFSSYKDGVTVSSRTNTSIDFPVIKPDQFEELYPLVYDSKEDAVREFLQLSKSDDYFNI
jgi:putative SbcD/Mre11-related phosphoesterase